MFLCIFFEIVKLKVHDFKDFLFLFFVLHFTLHLFIPLTSFLENFQLTKTLQKRAGYLPNILTLFSMRMTPHLWKEIVSFCMKMTRVNNVLHVIIIMMVVYYELFYESKPPGGVVMLYKNLQKFADKMNHERICCHLTSLDSLLCVTYCITQALFVSLTDETILKYSLLNQDMQ